MKRKLLTVLLAVVMVFGVFGLTACGGSNADEDYNYYGIKYEIEDEVNIEALTFQGIYKMFTTAGNFVVYVATEGANGATKADFQAVNKLAADWGVTIYHFNPELSGGYAADNENAVSTNIIKALDKTGEASQLKAVQDTLSAISGKKATTWSDNQVIAITGADSAVSGGKVSYKGKIAAANSVADGAKSIAAVATKNPSYGAYTEAARDIPYIPAAYNTTSIKTMNLFGDARLHMYNDDNGVDALTDEKTDLYVTVANYAMFAHLMDNNEGYFPVFFGGTWCGNTQAIVKRTNEIANDYGVQKIYFFDPRLEDGTKIDGVKATTTYSFEQAQKDVQEAQVALEKAQAALISDPLAADWAAMDTAWEAIEAAQNDVVYAQDALAANTDASKVAALTKAVEDAEAAVEKAEDAYEKAEAAATAYADAIAPFVADFTTYSADLKNATTDFEVASYVFDRIIAAREKVVKDAGTAATQAQKDAVTIAKTFVKDIEAYLASQEAFEKAAAAMDNIAATAGYTTTYEIVENSAYLASSLNTRTADGKGASYNFNFLYGKFLKDYLNTYKSEWNIQNADGTERFIEISVDGEKTNFTRMCVPNIMMFNGEDEGKAELVALSEAEYTYANVNEEGNAQNIAWTEAVKKVFDANPYLTYAPVVVAEAAPEAAAPAAGGSAPAASADSAC